MALDVDCKRPELETTGGTTVDVRTEGSPSVEETRAVPDRAETDVSEIGGLTPEVMTRLDRCDCVLVR